MSIQQFEKNKIAAPFLGGPLVHIVGQDLLGPFKMGGLNGFPFTGLTGMSAFSSHVPDNGAVLIFYGPILVSQKKELLEKSTGIDSQNLQAVAVL